MKKLVGISRTGTVARFGMIVRSHTYIFECRVVKRTILTTKKKKNWSTRKHSNKCTSRHYRYRKYCLYAYPIVMKYKKKKNQKNRFRNYNSQENLECIIKKGVRIPPHHGLLLGCEDGSLLIGISFIPVGNEKLQTNGDCKRSNIRRVFSLSPR